MSFNDQEKNNEQILDFLIQLGISYLEKGEYDNSIEKFKMAIDLGEENAKVYLNLSKAYILREQFDEEAQQVFEKSLQFEPENAVLNIILSQLYLDAGREDELALNVFQRALNHNPQNAYAIRTRLIKIHFQHGNIEAARELMQQFTDHPEKISSFLPFYVINEWKHHGFDQVNQYLKKAINIRENPIFYRWLIVNLIQAKRQSLEPIEFSIDDLNLCDKYFKDVRSFDHLLDVYLYPTIERLLMKYSKKIDNISSNVLDEYEVFLAENALSNIWEKALNKKEELQANSIPEKGNIWKKLEPWSIYKKDKSLKNESWQDGKIEEIYNQAEALLIIRLKGITSYEISSLVSDSVAAISKAEQTFIGGFQSSDGIIMFWKDIDNPIRMAINFIQDQSSLHLTNLDNEIKCQFLIHKLSRSDKETENGIVNDLQIALSPFELEREMFFQDNHSFLWSDNSRFQIFITSAVKEKMNSDSQFSLEPIKQSEQHPLSYKIIQIYQLHWDDSLAKIRQNKIKEIGRFKLLKELSQNPIFTSFKAIDKYLERLVIVKILNPDFVKDNDKNSTAELFLREAKIFGKLSHPNVAMVYDIGKDQNFCYLAREYVEGEPLAIQKSIDNKINVARTLTIFYNIARTLSYSHEQNIFHGRLQPKNIFISNKDDIKLTDFQLASFASPLKKFLPPDLKDLTYFAPEQIINNRFNKLTDIFSLGIIMFDLLTDHNPFYDSDRDKIIDNILNKNPRPPSFFNSEIPAQLDRFILKALEKSPEKRLQSMTELEKALGKLNK